jgi:hypothetical protein
MNFQEEYYKYKKMYLYLKKISQSGGMFLIKDFAKDFVVSSVPNSGIPKHGESMSNQCMFISISDFFTARGQRVTVSDLRLVGGIVDAITVEGGGIVPTTDLEFDDAWAHGVRALQNIARYYGVRISVYSSDDGVNINPKIKNANNTHIVPNTTYTADAVISTHLHTDADIVAAQHENTIHIIHRPGHFQLITKVTNNGQEVYNLSNILQPRLASGGFGLPPAAQAVSVLADTNPAYKNPPSNYPIAAVGDDFQKKQLKEIALVVPSSGKVVSVIPGVPSIASTISSSAGVSIGKPVTSPVASPVTSPVASPVTSPVTSPVASPVTSPVTSPKSSPKSSPVASPVASPKTSPKSSTEVDPIQTKKAELELLIKAASEISKTINKSNIQKQPIIDLLQNMLDELKTFRDKFAVTITSITNTELNTKLSKSYDNIVSLCNLIERFIKTLISQNSDQKLELSKVKEYASKFIEVYIKKLNEIRNEF